MSYFQYHPYIQQGNTKQLDISLKAAAVRKLFNTNMLADYTMQPEETAMTLAQDFYGNPEYDFIIHLANQIVDPIKDYPLKNKELIAYTEAKYQTDIYLTHHWEKDGIFYDSDPGLATAVSYIQYEETLNDLKRNIKILRPEFVSVVISQIEDMFKDLDNKEFPTRKIPFKHPYRSAPMATLTGSFNA